MLSNGSLESAATTQPTNGNASLEPKQLKAASTPSSHTFSKTAGRSADRGEATLAASTTAEGTPPKSRGELSSSPSLLVVVVALCLESAGIGDFSLPALVSSGSLLTLSVSLVLLLCQTGM